MNLRRQIARAGALAVCLLSFAAAAQSGYPSRPLRIIAPHATGVSPDVVARVMADKLSHALGQPVYVENKPGAGGLIGAEFAAQQPGDGYTLFFTVKAVMAIVPNVYPNPKYNPMTDFKGISQVGSVPHVLTAAPNAPFSTLKEMVDYAKAHPDEINYASTGIGTQPHVAMEAWQKKLGIKLHHIPYKADPGTDLMGGTVSLYLEGGAAAVPKVRAGRVKGLTITGSTRNPQVPNVPAANEYMADLDPDGVVSGSYHALFAPKGTPDEIVARLNREVAAIIAQAENAQRLANLGVAPASTTPAELNERVARDYQYWHAAIRELNVKPD